MKYFNIRIVMVMLSLFMVSPTFADILQKIKIGDLYYNLDEDTKEASVTCQDKTVFDPWTHAESDPIYRVRIDWEAIESQLLSTQSYEDAVREASEHKGYKVYVGEVGDIAFDPWKKKPAKKVFKGKRTIIKPVINVYPGMAINLSKSTAVYKNAVDKIPIKFVTGKFYVYSEKVIRNRIRITDVANVDKYEGNTSIILGMIELPKN